MRAARLITSVALCVALAGCRWLYGPAVDLPKSIDEAVQRPAVGARALLRMNQVDVELASWQPALVASLQSLGPRLDSSSATTLGAALGRAYALQRLYDRMATSVAMSWDPDAARQIFAFYDSWLGSRVLRAQASRRDPKTLEHFERFSASFDRASYSPTRIALLERIDRALLTSQTAVWLNRAYLDSALAALGEGVAPASAGPIRELRARYAAEEPSLYPLGAEQVLRWNLFAFAWLTEGDLERYAQFAESPAAQWWVVASARGYRVASSSAGEELFQALRPRSAEQR